METLLVLTILAILAGVAWPSLKRPFLFRRIHVAAAQVREAWSAARNLAQTTGQAQSFTFLPGSGEFQIQTYTALEPVSQEEATAFQAKNRALPDGVVFAGANVQSDSRATVTSFGDQKESESWSDAILFFPDGTATSAVVTIVGAEDRAVDVTLRGITGSSYVSDLYQSSASK